MIIGAGKTDITPGKDNIGMLGYGVPNHIVKDIHTRLFSRAFFISAGKDNSSPPVAIAVSEIAFITPALKKRVVELLLTEHTETGLTEASVLLCAQHTHSAPGGYSQHAFYNVSTPGYKPDILELYAQGITRAIVEAHTSSKPGKIKLGRGEVDPEVNVSFNRSLKAYNLNKDVRPLDDKDKHLAVNREMTLLMFEDMKGNHIGSVNWFAVHTTSMPNTSFKVHSDNKGYAALYLEEHHRDNPGYVAAFAHGNSGDVTPNYVHDKSRKHNRYWNGPFHDQDRNALYNGRFQFEQAKSIETNLVDTDPLSGTLDCALRWKDMSNMNIDNKFTGGEDDACTSPSCLGVDMFVGTFTDGLGFPDVIVPLARSISKGVKTYEDNLSQFIQNKRTEVLKRKYKAQGVKDILMETGDNRLLGTPDIKNFIMPGLVDKTVEWIKYFAKKGAFENISMTPQTLPFQIIRIGELAIVAIPFETTTIAGKRLQKAMEDQLLGNGIEHILICPYANAYNGYLTTFEEYQAQEYEGGHTVFGQWSLAAVTQICHELSEEFLKPKDERTIINDELPMPTAEDLEKMMY